MRVGLTVRHGSISEGIVKRVEAKLRKLERRLPPDTLLEVMLERVPGHPDDHATRAEAHVPGPNVVGREVGPTYETAADRLVDVLERQIERRRDKLVEEPRRRVV